MKKTVSLFIITFLFLTLSCSKKNEKIVKKRNWTVTLEEVCRDTSTQFTICATEEEKEKAYNQTTIGEPCNWVSIKDINGDVYYGYLRGASTGNNSCGK